MTWRTLPQSAGAATERPPEICHYPSCGKLAERGTDLRGKRLAYCSDPAHNRTTAKGARKSAMKAARRRLCRCGIIFQVTRSDKMFCSRKCKADANNARAGSLRKKPLRQAECEQCGTVFATRRDVRRFCTDACREQARYVRRQSR